MGTGDVPVVDAWMQHPTGKFLGRESSSRCAAGRAPVASTTFRSS
jgi:hypothetical protein